MPSSLTESPDFRPNPNMESTRKNNDESNKASQSTFINDTIPTDSFETPNAPWCRLTVKSKLYNEIDIYEDTFHFGRDVSRSFLNEHEFPDDDTYEKISRHHFSIYRRWINEIPSAVLIDHSYYGTFIGKKKIGKGQQCSLKDGDFIGIMEKGTSSSFRFQLLNVTRTKAMDETLIPPTPPKPKPKAKVLPESKTSKKKI